MESGQAEEAPAQRKKYARHQGNRHINLPLQRKYNQWIDTSRMTSDFCVPRDFIRPPAFAQTPLQLSRVGFWLTPLAL